MYEQPDEERPPDYTMQHDVLLFDWLEKKKAKARMKRFNPRMKSAENMQEVYHGDG
jgi:hypothetical protein